MSTQEEADTLHAVEIAASGDTCLHIYTQDTDNVLLLALRRVPQLGRNAALMSIEDCRHTVLLQLMYDAIGPRRAAAHINQHALTGCATTGHIRGKGKVTCLNTFMAAGPSVISAIINLGLGDEPSTEVTDYDGCEAFLCVLFCPQRVKVSQAKEIRWLQFKQLKADQGVDKLPPTPGAWAEHIRRARLQANIWSQDIILDPVIPDPLTLGWKEEDGKLMPVLSIAPDCVLQLVKCACGVSRQSSVKCTRRKHKLDCTELCHCDGEEDVCANRPTSSLPSEDDECNKVHLNYVKCIV